MIQKNVKRSKEPFTKLPLLPLKETTEQIYFVDDLTVNLYYIKKGKKWQFLDYIHFKSIFCVPSPSDTDGVSSSSFSSISWYF